MKQRVLAVDLDFQASLSGLCLKADAVELRKLGIEAIMRNPFGDITTLTFENAVPTREANMRLLSCGELLPNIEERAKAAWLMNPGDADLRCVFRRILHDPVFQNAYDVILIDCPPRWTAASINAIACCDYVLIPTSLDRVSTEAVPRLLKWLRNLQKASPELYGHLHVLGVVGNRAHPRAKLIAREQRAWDVLQARSRNAWGEKVHHFATVIQEKAGIHLAADHREFAVLNPELLPTFEKLVIEINARRSEHEGS